MEQETIVVNVSVIDVGIGFKLCFDFNGLKLSSYKTFDTEDEALGYFEFVKEHKK